jgi:gamma-glutamyl-gamma-aminobutyrate hydrolase PuuD
VARTPVIGITTYMTPAQWGYWDLEAALIPADYVRATVRAGGRPLLVPPCVDGLSETLDALDGLVLTGGSDIDPAAYGDEVHPETFGIHSERDEAEFALLEGALERDMPVLGICRGSQVINVACGGDLHQHLPELVGHEGHKHNPPGQFLDHEVRVEPGTRLSRVIGRELSVKSHHHQGFRRIGEGLIEAAHAEDGTVEAVEHPAKSFVLGVLWHPEAGENMRLFDALVAEARRYRGEPMTARQRQTVSD